MERRHLVPSLSRRHGRERTALVLLGVVTALAGVVVLVTPAAADVAVHQAYIQTGSCPVAGEVVGSLEDLVAERELPAVGSVELDTHPVRASLTGAVPLSFGDLFATPHSVVVLQAPSESGARPVVLCGNLSGYPLAATDVAVGLGQVDDSGFSGIATLHDNGDASIDVAVYMTTRDPWVGDVD